MARQMIPLPRSADRPTQAIADASRRQQRQATAIKIFDGDGREHDVSLEIEGTQIITHGLGRLPRGWLIHTLEVPAASTGVCPYVQKGSVNDKTLVVATDCDAASTCKIYVF